ncbi:Calcium/proton exchanger protein [Dioscorea alata]|uniref:Calcium/proton exchanger protein n=1 Tax=Dioscorea alata TaxID=55571 RepID=A0ACB7W3P5_DIOAL|nr:Calcium/proton exchanger protein [Dioscorea alata]
MMNEGMMDSPNNELSLLQQSTTIPSSSKIQLLLTNFQQVLLGTKLALLFPAAPLALLASHYHFGTVLLFSFSLFALAPLAERVSFLSEQIAYYAGPTVGGLVNATCGNAPELIIALMALQNDKVDVLKWSLLGSTLSNLLLVLGSSLFFGGLANLSKESQFDLTQVNVNLSLLLLCSQCHILALMVGNHTSSSNSHTTMSLDLSRACSIVMLITYFACLFFQLKTHRQQYDILEDDSSGNEASSDDDDAPVIGFTSACIWLVIMTTLVAIISEYIVGTIEDASRSWGMSVSFLCIILLPIAGNASEHAGAIIFAYKNKIDIALSVTLGSSTQITMFVTPVSVIVAWIRGISMDLDYKLLETASLVMSILIVSLILQDGKWHYMKGVVLVVSYIVIGLLFFNL